MADSFFEYMYGSHNGGSTEASREEAPTNGSETIVQDEAIGVPWTHKFTVYCANPSRDFMEELKAKDGVVAVYMKEKTEKPAAVEDTPPDNK